MNKIKLLWLCLMNYLNVFIKSCPMLVIRLRLIPYQAGGLHTGFMVLSGKDESLIAEGLEELNKLLPRKAFFSRGKRGPKLVMTDDDKATINAVAKV